MLSTHRCTVDDQQAFSTTNDLEFAGEDHEVGGYVRLASGPGIHVQWTALDGTTEDNWLVGVPDNMGALHYFEAGYTKGMSGLKALGPSWSEIIATNLEWLKAEDSGIGLSSDPLRFVDPVSKNTYEQIFDEDKTIQVFACIDDSGNVVSAYPLECDANRLAPPSDSCWASIGTSQMNTWW
jgi:hypothetical protein